MTKDMSHELIEEDEDIHHGDGFMGGRFTRWMNQFTRRVEDEEEMYEEPEARPIASSAGRLSSASPLSSTLPPPPRPATFRTASNSSRESAINVMPVSSFGDIQKAADRLKNGEPQIINLEKTPPEVAERLIDFLNGVTYALDGYVEKISEGAYLFTPSHIAIHAEGPDQPQHKPFFDRL